MDYLKMIIFFLILTTLIDQLCDKSIYRPYLRLMTGFMLISLMMQPISYYLSNEDIVTQAISTAVKGENNPAFLDGAKEEKQNQIKEQITTLFSQYDLKVLDVDSKVNEKSCSYGEDRFKKAIKFGWGRRPYNKYCVIMDNWIHRHEEGIAYRRMEYVNEVLNRYGLKWFSNKHNEIMLKYGIFPQKLVGYYLLDRNLDNKINKYVINKHYVDKWEEDEEFEIGQSLYFDQKIDFEKLGMYNTIYQYDGQAFTIAGRRN